MKLDLPKSWYEKRIEKESMNDQTTDDVARLRKEKDEIVDGVKHAISEILEHFDDNDEFARSLRNHLMGTITDKHGEAYQTELDAAINTIGQLQHRNGHLQEAAEIWERNSEDACQLWELLRQVDQEAGNSAAPARRHSLTPMLRDDIEKILREKPKPEDRITAIREERVRPVTEEWVRSLGFTDADPKRYAHLELQFSNRPAFIVVECDLSIGIAIGDGRDPEYTHVFPNSQPTKVQLLDLLSGLGIEPKREGGGV